MNKLKILLTGGTGFIGKSFIENFKSRYEIVAPKKSETDLLNAGAVKDLFSKYVFDAVVHLAGTDEGSQNLTMFKNIQHMSLLYGVKKLIIAGEGAEYDRRFDIDNIKETDEHAMPVDSYGLNRYLIARLAKSDIITTNLRLFTVFGANQSPKKSVIADIIFKGAQKRNICIPKDKVFSTVYVQDLIKIIAAFLDNDLPKGDYNVVNPQAVSLMQTAKAVKNLAKTEGVNINIELADNMPLKQYCADNAKLTEILPKFKFTSFNTAIKAVYQQSKTVKTKNATKKSNTKK